MPTSGPPRRQLAQTGKINREEICFIIVASGQGKRFGGETPKQFYPLDGRPILMRSIENVRTAFPAATVILAISEEHAPLWEELCREHSFDSPPVSFGGASRWESVKKAISKIPGRAGIISIHDGVRPLASPALIRRVISAVGDKSGAVPVLAVTDSLCRILPGGHPQTADREKFRIIQTPQAFNAEKLIEAYSLPFNEAFTDDSSVLAAAGYSDISLVEGEPTNIKITYPVDIEIASLYLKRP